MIRTCLEFLLSRSYDACDSPPTLTDRWLQHWFDRRAKRNPQVDNFAADAQQLDRLLRQSAAQHRQQMAAETVPPTLTPLPTRLATNRTATSHDTSRRSLAWTTGLAAAVLLGAFLGTTLRPSPPKVHAGEFSQQLTVVPGEVLRFLNSAADVSSKQLPQLSPLTQLKMPALPDWRNVAQSIDSPVRTQMDMWQGNWQDTWQGLKSRLPTKSPEI